MEQNRDYDYTDKFSDENNKTNKTYHYSSTSSKIV